MKNSAEKFEALGIPLFLISRLAERGIFQPTEIQEKAIPLLLQKKNLIFGSPTGTGKTFAYLLPILGRMQDMPHRFPGLLIAAPTFELCSQIKNEVDFLLKGTGLKTLLLIGQSGLTRQVDSLKKDAPAVVIGNPGRLLVLAKMGKLVLSELRYVILDEGDRLVSDELFDETGELFNCINQKTFVKETDRIYAACSATIPPGSRERLLHLLGDNTAILECPGSLLREKVEHWAIFSENRRKKDTLRSFIAAANPHNKKGSFKALIFTSRTGDVSRITAYLQAGGLGTAGIWGGMKNHARRQSLDDFRSGRIRLLVTSDLAARGLDIPDISHIISLDTGTDSGVYIHRAGRTARAGKKGIMVTIGSEAEMRRLAMLEKKLGIKIYPRELFGGKISIPAV